MNKRLTSPAVILPLLTTLAIGCVALATLAHDKRTNTLLPIKEPTVLEQYNATVLHETSVGDLRQVTLDFVDGSSESYFVDKGQVKSLVEATKKLHYDPGVNPYSGKRTLAIKQISVAEPQRSGPYWWATPDLKNSDDVARGAFIFEWNHNITTLWEDPDEK